jgi:hypothetical protein
MKRQPIPTDGLPPAAQVRPVSESDLLRIGLIGWPVEHSVSPAMHHAAFEALGLQGRYEPLPTPPQALAAVLGDLQRKGYRGANVTIPHKQAVIPYLNELTDAALAGGAALASKMDRPRPGLRPPQNKFVGPRSGSWRYSCRRIRHACPPRSPGIQLWTGHTPPVDIMFATAKRALESQAMNDRGMARLDAQP